MVLHPVVEDLLLRELSLCVVLCQVRHRVSSSLPSPNEFSLSNVVDSSVRTRDLLEDDFKL